MKNFKVVLEIETDDEETLETIRAKIFILLNDLHPPHFYNIKVRKIEVLETRKESILSFLNDKK